MKKYRIFILLSLILCKFLFPNIILADDFYNGFSEGLALVRDPETEKYGYININGELTIPYRYGSDTQNFKNGLAYVGNNRYIDKSGKVVINTKI